MRPSVNSTDPRPRSAAWTITMNDVPTAPRPRYVLGVTGGIAAYKTAELTRLLVKDGADVDVVMTAAAQHFVTAATFQALSGRAVLTDLWATGADNAMGHIGISRGADRDRRRTRLADFISKLARGPADDLLSTLCLARDCPLLVAPAMNRRDVAQPRHATQRRAASRRRHRDPRPRHRRARVQRERRRAHARSRGAVRRPRRVAAAKVLDGKRVLVTAGPTFEAIDPVRGITNSSSGKMGFALAQAAAEAGAEVTMVAGPSSLATARGLDARRREERRARWPTR